MERLRIKNWEKFQHYKERKPPWIKLYREILDDVEWHELPGEAAKGLIMLWLIASEDSGYLPDSKTLSFRLRVSENRVNALLSYCSAWFEGGASEVLAGCEQDAMPDLRDRGREETEKEAEGEKGFHPPTQNEVCAFMQSRKIPDAERQAELFIAHHANRKWRLGGGKGPVMVSWRKAVVTWQANIPKFSGGSNGTVQQKSFDAIRREEGDGATRRLLDRHLGRASEAGTAPPALPGRVGKADLH